MDRLELADSALNEAKDYIKRGDPSQCSEKIYKVIEQCVKLLAEENKLPEYEEAKKEGRWWTHLLARAASRLARNLKERKIEDAWNAGYNLHVWGFHENKLDIAKAVFDLPYAEWILDYTKNTRKDYEQKI